MNEAELIDRLAALQPPQAEPARDRALAAVPDRVHAARTERPRRHRRRLAPAVASVAAGLVAFSLLTAPGHAFTNWVGERIGLGHPGGPPSLQELFHSWQAGTSAHGVPAYVLLRGSGPQDGHYELITYRMKAQPGAEFPANGARCFQLEFPEARKLFSVGCGLPPARRGLIFEGVGGNSAPGMAYQFASGLVSDDVASVDVMVNGRPLPVEVQPIPPDLIERFAIRRPFKFFIAILDEQRGGTITATARDASGHPLAKRTARIFSPAGWPTPGQNRP